MYMFMCISLIYTGIYMICMCIHKYIMFMLGSSNCNLCLSNTILNNTILNINEYMYDISACICSYIYH